MSKLKKWWCTELYPTNAEEEIGIVGDFAVYQAAEVEAVMTKLEEQLNDAHGACCEAGIEEQYESSGDLVYYTVAARIRLLTAQVTKLEQERNDLQARVKELEKMYEYRRST